MSAATTSPSTDPERRRPVERTGSDEDAELAVGVVPSVLIHPRTLRSRAWADETDPRTVTPSLSYARDRKVRGVMVVDPLVICVVKPVWNVLAYV